MEKIRLEFHYFQRCFSFLKLCTLTELEEAGGENGWTEESKEDGATDQLEASVFTVSTEPLPDGVEGVAEITVDEWKGRGWRKGGRS